MFTWKINQGHLFELMEKRSYFFTDIPVYVVTMGTEGGGGRKNERARRG